MSKYDIPYAYELFNKISSTATVNGQPLGAILVDGTYNLWHCLAQSAFFDDCVAFSGTKRFQAVSRSTFSITYFFVGGLAFLITLISLIGVRFGQKRVLVYSVDRLSPRGRFDFRMEKVYKELERVPYIEVFHTVVGKRFLENLFKRRRVGLYLEGLEWAYYLLRFFKRIVSGRAPKIEVGGLEGLHDDERQFAEALVSKYISIAPLIRYRTDFLERALKGRIRVIFAIDDARHYHEVMIAARRLGIPSYAFQHGHVTPYHLAWLKAPYYQGAYARPDYLLVWNDYWKHELRALDSVWPDDVVMVAGNPKEFSVLAVRRAGPNVPRVVVIPYETHAPHEVVRTVLAHLVQCGVAVVIKVRPDVPREHQLAPIGDLPAGVRVITHLSELAEPVTAVVGTSSTFLYDAAEAGLPVGLIKTPLQYTKRMVQNGLAEDMTAGGVCAGVEKLAALTDADIAFRQKVLASASHLPAVIRDILARTDGVG